MENPDIIPPDSTERKLMVKVKNGTGDLKEGNVFIVDTSMEPVDDCLVLALMMNIGVATLISSEDAKTNQFLILGVVTTLISA
nr:hypothetical protein [uncultured Arsenicibacter sp.]